MLCVAWPGCPQGCLVRCSAGYTGGESGLEFSLFLPRGLSEPSTGALPRWERPALSKPPRSPHVPCSQSPFSTDSLSLGVGHRCKSLLPNTHIHLFWKGWQGRRVWCCCGSPGPQVSVRPVLNSVPTQGTFRPAAERRSLCSWSCWLVPCPQLRPQLEPTVLGEPPLFICGLRGTLGRPPLAPFNQEKRGREAAASMAEGGALL